MDIKNNFVVAHCDKKLTLARNYIDKITNCKNKKSENEEEKYLANFGKKNKWLLFVNILKANVVAPTTSISVPKHL